MPDDPVRLSSSLRAVPPEVTLGHAKVWAERLGITRVTDITRLDRPGIPVYTSIRPNAVPGSLCVNAGKGLRPIEAQIGAYMEAIEFALAEPGASPVARIPGSARDVLDGRERSQAILDFCPKLGAEVSLDAPMELVVAHDIVTGEATKVPAELVFLPFRPHPDFKGYFGTSSNGLASGNTVREATIHAIAELLERDIRSFEAVRDTSSLLDLSTVEGPARGLVTLVEEAGLELYVRSADNVFGVPYFTAVINDPDSLQPHLLNGGFGCHPHRSVAFIRAVAEAAQSRLSFIHGGRDDLQGHHDRFKGWDLAKKRAFVAKVVAKAGDPTRTIPMSAVADHSATVTTLDACEDLLLGRLRDQGLTRVLRVAYTAPDDALQVVRAIVPGLELFGEGIVRVGARLRDHARKN
jgi:ribosomal protein S12 methylthiotransferase accessory factor